MKKSLGVKTAKELNGASICVQTGTTTELNLADFIDVKGWKALGNRLTQFDVAGKISEVNKLPQKVDIGTTIELDVNPKAGKKGNQGDLF